MIAIGIKTLRDTKLMDNSNLEYLYANKIIDFGANHFSTMWQTWMFIMVFIRRNDCVTWLDVKNDYETLVNSYTFTSQVKTTTEATQLTNIAPTNDHDKAITVNIGLDIFSVTSFDAVVGRLDILGSVKLKWQDDIPRSANPLSRNVESIMIDYTKIWTPTLILLNSADSVSSVGDSAYKVRFFTTNGTVTWSPRVIMAATCTPDVSFFPFDQQECDLILTAWSRDKSEIVFSLMSNEWGMSNFDPSNVWEVMQTSSELVTVSNRNAAKFSVIIKRYSLYFAFNIVLPILLLSFLSGFLFLLPVDSGERVGFGITCFLSFAVLLQTIMGFLPQSSAPMSLLCYYVIVMVLFSGLLSIVNILILKVYLKPEGTNVPRFLVHFIELIQCTKFKRCYRHCRKNKVVPSEIEQLEEINLEETEDPDVDISSVEKKPKDKTTMSEGKHRSEAGAETSETDEDMVDWYSVGRFLDFFFLLAFLGVQGAFSVFFLIPLGVRY